MTVQRRDVLFFGGGASVEKFGALSWRNSPTQESAETHTRAATATFTDPNGDSKTAAANVPRVTWLDDDSDGVYETPALLLGTGDLIYWPWPWRPMAMTILVDFDLLGLMADAAAVLSIGDATSTTTPRLVIESTGTYFQVTHDNGTTFATATLAAAPSQNDRVELLVTIASDGSVTIEQSVNQAASTSDADATAVSNSAWSAERLYANSDGSSSAGDIQIRAIKAVRGAATLSEMRSLFA